MCLFSVFEGVRAFVFLYSTSVYRVKRGGVSYCSAVMYPASCGVHCTPATSTLPSSSEKDRPRFRPWMVTSVPPSRGPATGLTYTGGKKQKPERCKVKFNVQWFSNIRVSRQPCGRGSFVTTAASILLLIAFSFFSFFLVRSSSMHNFSYWRILCHREN